MAQQAQDTFVAVLADGTERLVTKGDMLPDSHELVKRDAKGAGTLFKPVNIDGDEEPRPKSAPAKAEPKAPAAVKAEPPKAAAGAARGKVS